MRVRLALALALTLASAAAACGGTDPERARLEARAAGITITRDDWGVPHVRGKTDADAVFGLMYAQAEDDFHRVETNYLYSLGRLAEAEGDSVVYRDLRQRLFIDPDTLQALYAGAEPWLKALMDAWADGLNFYLATHPQVKPRVLTRFEPWMALSFSEGSIGGDIEDISVKQLAAFYGGDPTVAAGDARLAGPYAGSNGFAIAPANSASGKALLWINPHTSFFFREEAHVTSDEGLDAYGALTWGQFFVYQGFNARAGWMHTSSGADVVDEWAESIVKRGDSLYYEYADSLRPLRTQRIALRVRDGDSLRTREVTVYRSHHGPIVREADGKWIAVNLMNEPVKALTQSYTRTKARTLAEFRRTMELYTNSSNNTVYADADGNIAYFHANHVPRRDPRFDWGRPVDGRTPATEWQGVHTLDESPNVINPKGGWIQNTNNWPYSAAGPDSPRQRDYPSYFDGNYENPRGQHALRVLQGQKGFTPATLRDAAFDSYLPAFPPILAMLVKAYDAAPAASPLKAKLAGPVAALRDWDFRWGAGSVPTTLAVFWGDRMWRAAAADAEAEGTPVLDYIVKAIPAERKLEALADAVDSLTAQFGDWKTPWGEVNRFQRLTGDIVQPFNDSAPSLPVPFTSSRWGSLAAFQSRPYPGTRKWYGTSGNSFVAAVEFGDSVRAMAVTAGGLHSVPGSRHFNDQAERYAKGDLRPVYFYPNQLQGHVERTYSPGK